MTEFLVERETFQTKVVEKARIRIICSTYYLPKVIPFSDNVEKYGIAGQSTYVSIMLL
jgi:hypothetical protein